MTLQPPSLFDDEPAEPKHAPQTPPPSGLEYGIKRSQDSANRWTKEQTALVDYTIILVARRLNEFTADDIWRELPDGFPVTKGMAARLVSLERRGLISHTGEYQRSNRGGTHDHGQRLSVWCRRGAEQ